MKTRVVNLRKEKYCCISCGKKLNSKAKWNNTKRCSSCEMKRKHKLGKAYIPSRYIDGRKKRGSKCIDCDKKIEYSSMRCQICYHIHRKNQKWVKGKNNPNWKGGISKLPYSFKFNNELKKEIFKRDNYTCQLCFIYPTNKLTVHHIDYNKQNCKKDNLITLCRSCNSKVNFNRENYIIYFKGAICQKQL